MKDEIDGGRKQLQIHSIIDRDEESLRGFQRYQGLREKNGDHITQSMLNEKTITALAFR